MWALGSVWSVLLTLGLGVAAGPPVCTISKVCQDVVQVQVHSHKATLMSEAMTVANGLFAVGLGLLIGIPIAVAAGMLLFQALGRGWWVCLTSKFMILAMWLLQDSPLITFLICMSWWPFCHLLFCIVIYFRSNIQVFFLSRDNLLWWFSWSFGFWLSGKQLQGLWRGDLIALKGCCPNCGEEVRIPTFLLSWCRWFWLSLAWSKRELRQTLQSFVMMTRKLNLMNLGYLQLLGLVLSSMFDIVCKVVCLMHQNKFCNWCKSDANTCELPCPLGKFAL